MGKKIVVWPTEVVPVFNIYNGMEFTGTLPESRYTHGEAMRKAREWYGKSGSAVPALEEVQS